MEVRRPIDLTTVARRLRRGTYDSCAGRLRRDIVRIFTNCEKFNTGSGQLFVGIARHLRVSSYITVERGQAARWEEPSASS